MTTCSTRTFPLDRQQLPVVNACLSLIATQDLGL